MTAPQATWPHPGDELAAAVDPANPLNFVVQWATVPGHDDTPAPAGPPTSGWDPGPDGTHSAAVADWLAERGFTAGDFGPLLEGAAPGMTALLDVAAGRYATVIRGAAAVALMTHGQPAQGVVLKTEKLSIPPQMLPSPDACLAWLTLRVQPSDTAGAGSSGRAGTGASDWAGTGASDNAGTGYETTIRFGFRSPERFAALATVGTELPLRVDPTDPAKVTLDLPALGITPQ